MGEQAETALIKAVSEGEAEQASELLWHGADANAKMGSGESGAPETVLQMALARNDDVMASLLLEHGADPKRYRGQEAAPLNRLVWLRANMAMLKQASGIADCLARMLEMGADPNIIAGNSIAGGGISKSVTERNTPLHIACEYGWVDWVQLLLRHGAAVNLPREDGLTPLDVALGRDDPELVSQLLGAGAMPLSNYVNLFSRSKYGAPLNTLHHALETGVRQCIPLLLDEMEGGIDDCNPRRGGTRRSASPAGWGRWSWHHC